MAMKSGVEQSEERCLELDTELKQIYIAYGGISLEELLEFCHKENIQTRDVSIIASGDPYCGTVVSW